MDKHQKLQGLTVGSREQQLEMIRAINTTGVKPVIDRTFGLLELAEAFRYEASGKHFGKICIGI